VRDEAEVYGQLAVLLAALLDALASASERVVLQALAVLGAIAGHPAHFRRVLASLLDRWVGCVGRGGAGRRGHGWGDLLGLQSGRCWREGARKVNQYASGLVSGRNMGYDRLCWGRSVLQPFTRCGPAWCFPPPVCPAEPLSPPCCCFPILFLPLYPHPPPTHTPRFRGEAGLVLLQKGGPLVLRRLCAAMGPEVVFREFASILEGERDTGFAGTMVQVGSGGGVEEARGCRDGGVEGGASIRDSTLVQQYICLWAVPAVGRGVGQGSC
jgi:hypothetical protein